MKGGTLPRVLAVLAVLAVAGATVAWAATAASNEPPLTPASFALVSDGNTIATFGELGGIVSGIDPSQLELMTGTALKLPGKRTPPTVTLKRGMTRDTALWAWHEAALAGQITARRSSSIVMYSTDGTEIARWSLIDAWPSKIEIEGFKPGSSEVAVETITIVCERIQRVPV